MKPKEVFFDSTITNKLARYKALAIIEHAIAQEEETRCCRIDTVLRQLATNETILSVLSHAELNVPLIDARQHVSLDSTGGIRIEISPDVFTYRMREGEDVFLIDTVPPANVPWRLSDWYPRPPFVDQTDQKIMATFLKEYEKIVRKLPHGR